MGFFSKVWKKVKKGFKSAFKSIGKGIKKVFKGFGKFMGKIGIVGQLAMSFILPGIGGALMKTAGNAFTGLTGALGASGNVILKGAGKMLEMGANFAKMGHSAFKTVTDGITSFASEMSQAAVSKIPGIKTIFPDMKTKTFKAAWSNVENEFIKNRGRVSAAFNDLIGNTAPMPTAGELAADSLNKAIGGEGTIPSSVAETKPFEVPELKTTPKTTFDMNVDIPDKVKMEMPEFKADIPKVEINIPKPTVETKSLLDKGVDLVKDFGTEVKENITERIKKTPETVGNYVGNQVEGALVSAVVGDDGQQYVEEEAPGMSIGAAPYQQVTVGQYNSQEINDRAYQMAVNPVGYGMQNPFGYTAQDSYQQQMLQFTRPQYG